MNDSWDERRRAKEEEYFNKKNAEALTRLKERKDAAKQRLSPITGEPMEELTIMGVVVDRCPTSKGIWLDAGELEEILNVATGVKSEDELKESNYFAQFLATLTGKN